MLRRQPFGGPARQMAHQCGIDRAVDAPDRALADLGARDMHRRSVAVRTIEIDRAHPGTFDHLLGRFAAAEDGVTRLNLLQTVRCVAITQKPEGGHGALSLESVAKASGQLGPEWRTRPLEAS